MQNPLLSIPTTLFTQFTGQDVGDGTPLELIAHTHTILNHWLRFERHRVGDNGIYTQVLLYDDRDKAMLGRVSESLLQIKVRPIEQGDYGDLELDDYVIVTRVVDNITSYPGYSNVHGMNLLFFSYQPAGMVLLTALELIKHALSQRL